MSTPYMYYGMDGELIDRDTMLARYRTPNERRVAYDEIHETYVVSTVLLCINHGYDLDKPPQIFETMVFRVGSWMDLECERYSTKEQAKAGHKSMVERVRTWAVERVWNGG